LKDHHIKSLHREIEPVALSLMEGNWDGYISVCNNTREVEKLVTDTENTWLQFADSQPFEYSFFDEDYIELYKAESKAVQLFLAFSILTILLAGLSRKGNCCISFMKTVCWYNRFSRTGEFFHFCHSIAQ
jgi:hypothetical protein